MQGIFQKENTDKALKYGIYRHLPTYEKIIRNLVSFLIKNKGVFRKEHSAEIALYETARKFLKEKSGNIKLPSMKLLKEKKEELLKQKKSAQEQYQYYRDYQKELNTVRSNINSILGKEYPHQKTHTKEQTLT